MTWKNNSSYQESDLRLSRTNNGSKPATGISYTWRLWRHCCCRFGWYPLLIAPIITAGCVLSLYSAGGCDFVRLNVGFYPSNEAWMDNTAELGLFFYQSGDEDTNKYKAAFLEGCREYSSEFQEDFINDDRTWKVARIMAYVAGGSSILSTILVWLFVLSPLPATFFWPGVMLPALMAAFLAEGSKFLFFDTAVCRNNVWFPPGADSLPQAAESCSLGVTGKYSIAAGAVFFICLVTVCLRAPEQRDLNPNYGIYQDHNDQIDTSEDFNEIGSERDHYDAMPTMDSHYRGDESEFTITSRGYDSLSRGYKSEFGRSGSIHDDNELELFSQQINSLDYFEAKHKGQQNRSNMDEEDDEEDKYNPRKPPNTVTTTPNNNNTPKAQIISQSRLSTAEKLQKNATPTDLKQEFIDKFVSELNASFQIDTKQEEQTPADLTRTMQEI